VLVITVEVVISPSPFQAPITSARDTFALGPSTGGRIWSTAVMVQQLAGLRPDLGREINSVKGEKGGQFPHPWQSTKSIGLQLAPSWRCGPFIR
jgi:hypothetical protein